MLTLDIGLKLIETARKYAGRLADRVAYLGDERNTLPNLWRDTIVCTLDCFATHEEPKVYYDLPPWIVEQLILTERRKTNAEVQSD